MAAAQDGNRTLIAVLLNVKERNDIFRDAITLFEAAFNQPKVEQHLLKKGKQKHTLMLQGATKPIATTTDEDLILAYHPAEEPKIKAYLSWDKLALPIKRGQRVGELRVYTGDKLFKAAPLYAEEEVEATFASKLKSSVFAPSKMIKIGGIIALIICLSLLLLRRAR